MGTLNFSKNVHSSIKIVGASFLGGGAHWRNQLALREKLKNLHAKFQISSFLVSEITAFIRTDRQTD